MHELGTPHLHLRRTDSTNARARALAQLGAPHGTLVSAAEQSAGRGRQGRSWSAPAGSSLLCSLVLRDAPATLPLAAGVAVAEAIDVSPARTAGARPPARIKWPNDILLDGRKVAGILAEGRPAEGWAVLGIGINVAVDVERDLPVELHERAASLGLGEEAVTDVLHALLAALERWLAAPGDALLAAWRERDWLLGREVRWDGPGSAHGIAQGIDGDGRLVVGLVGGGHATLDAGEVHLASHLT